MSIIAAISALSAIKNLLPSGNKLIDLAGRVVDGKATKEELDAEAAKHELSAEVQLALAQIKLNTAEASHPSLFVAGWRSFIGWVGGIVLAFNYIVFPIGSSFGLELPMLDLNSLMPVILGMLGVSASRSYEKVNGVHRNNMKS